MANERRRAPRVEILGRVSGRSFEGGGEIKVLEMSLGGMAVETPEEMPIGSRCDFRLTLGDGATIPLVGRVRHCRNTASLEETPRFVSGVEFTDEEPSEGQLQVGDIIRRIT